MFHEGQQLDLPNLASSLELPSPRFVVRRVLRGGMGVCAKVTHDDSGRVFALKLINEQALTSDHAFRRFAEEVKLWTTASTCDVVVQVFSIFRLNELPCVCSEWMEGGDLRGQLGSRNPQLFYRSVDRILAGLEWVYSNYGILHRDLKPENLLLDEGFNCFIADWGISRVVSSDTSDPVPSQNRPKVGTSLTQTGQFIGTVIYSSPEQIIGSKVIDHRADIYSVGCILFEWESGSPPFIGTTPDQIAYQHLERQAPRVGGFLKHSRFGVEKIIARCLQKKPSDRYQTYADLRSELRNCAKLWGIEFSPFTPTARETMPLIGGEEVRRKGFKDAIVGSKGYAIVEQAKVLPYLKEASVLCTVGEWKKAYDILIRLYSPEMVTKFPDDELHQLITINLGHCLWGQGRAAEAIDVLTTISRAETKPPEYFVNLSLALLHAQRWAEAETAARQGLELYPNDADILGNLGIALGSLRKHADTLDIAQRRLVLSRDVHSLEELAVAHMSVGNESEDLDWPRATREFATAIRLLDEAKNLNPRYLTGRLNLARAWFYLDDFAASSKELDSTQFDTWTRELGIVMRAECLNRVAAFEECLTFCDKWLKELPDSIGLQRVRAETMVDGYVIGMKKDGRRVVEDSSFEFFTRIVNDSKGRRPSDFRYLARLTEWMGQMKAALELIDTAEKLEPKHWEDSFNRAVFYWHLGDLKSALYHGQKACTLAPWRPQTWRLIAGIQDSLGQKTDAQSSRDRDERVSQERRRIAQAAVRGLHDAI